MQTKQAQKEKTKPQAPTRRKEKQGASLIFSSNGMQWHTKTNYGTCNNINTTTT
jgi:hypothetical protein